MPTHPDPRLQRLGQIHHEVNRRADNEVRRAIAAGVGTTIQGDKRKFELIEEAERLLSEMLAELRPRPTSS